MIFPYQYHGHVIVRYARARSYIWLMDDIHPRAPRLPALHDIVSQTFETPSLLHAELYIWYELLALRIQ